MNLVHNDLVVGYYYYHNLSPDSAPAETCGSSLDPVHRGDDIPPWNLADTLGIIAMFSAPFAIAPLVCTGAGLLIPIAAGPIAAKGAVVVGAKVAFSAAASTKVLIQTGFALVAGVSGGFAFRRRR